MGDMLEGFGDEVVLFVAFLTLSLIFLTVFSCFRRPRRPERTRTPSAETSPAQQLEVHHPAASRAVAEGLRHRPQATSLPDGDSRGVEATITSRTVEQQQNNDNESRNDSTEQEYNSEIHIRLIQATGSGDAREVVIAPNTTLEYLRR